MSGLVLRADADGVATLTLNRPEKRNALDMATFEALDAHVAAIEREGEAVRVVVLGAAGPLFCAGADLSTAKAGPPSGIQARVIDRLAALPQPVVAAIHADCITGGLELILAADIVVAAADAGFVDTHGRWGLVPNWGIMQRLPRRIGRARAGWLAYTGRRIDAATAERWGLVDLCVPADRFEAELVALVADIAGQSGFTTRAYKRCYAATADLPLADGLSWERDNWPGSAPDALDRVAAAFGKGR